MAKTGREIEEGNMVDSMDVFQRDILVLGISWSFVTKEQIGRTIRESIAGTSLMLLLLSPTIQ